MPTYTHTLITRGKWKGAHRGWTPILLVPIETPMSDLRRLLQIEVDKRIRVFLKDDAPQIDILRASAHPYVHQLLTNLWRSEVRLAGDGMSWQDDKEEATYWTLASSGRFVPDWQGGADGVIPVEAPVTIRDRESKPTPFFLLDV